METMYACVIEFVGNNQAQCLSTTPEPGQETVTNDWQPNATVLTLPLSLSAVWMWTGCNLLLVIRTLNNSRTAPIHCRKLFTLIVKNLWQVCVQATWYVLVWIPCSLHTRTTSQHSANWRELKTNIPRRLLAEGCLFSSISPYVNALQINPDMVSNCRWLLVIFNCIVWDRRYSTSC